MGSRFRRNHFQYLLSIEFRTLKLYSPNVAPTLLFDTGWVTGVTR